MSKQPDSLIDFSPRLYMSLSSNFQVVDCLPRCWWDCYEQAVFLEDTVSSRVFALFITSRQHNSIRVLVLIKIRPGKSFSTRLLPLDEVPKGRGNIVAALVRDLRTSPKSSISWAQLTLHAPWIFDYTSNLTIGGFFIHSTRYQEGDKTTLTVEMAPSPTPPRN